MLDIYSKVVCPTNYTIDWTGFFIWCAINDVVNIKTTAIMLVEIRGILIDIQNKKFDGKNKETITKKDNSLLQKKFGG